LAPEPLDAHEAERVAEAVETLGLRYVVLTSVARDDQGDHGASLFTAAMAAIRARNPLVAIEVLTPDFWGGYREEAEAIAAQRQRLSAVLDAGPVCFNHNLETVERLQGEVRRGATYRRSLGLLAAARELAPQIPNQERPDAGARRKLRGGGGGDAGSPRRGLSDGSPLASTCGPPSPISPSIATAAQRSSRSWGPSPENWALPMCAPGRWCAAAITTEAAGSTSKPPSGSP